MDLKGKVVLVTGAGGSIGQQLVDTIISKYEPAKMILLDISEYNLYCVNRITQGRGVDCELLIADIRHEWLMECIFNETQPNVVYHAAALKHVPMLETGHNSIEAVRTNVLGTLNVYRQAAKTYSVEAFTFISTDKAVRPTSMMGATKTIAEGLVGEYVGFKTSIVRFGNVINSSGSVYPLFEQQAKGGGPLTVTSKDMVRYFMSIADAVELTLVASTQFEGGVYVLDMGEAVYIDEIARTICAVHGLNPDKSIEYIGLREGEKLYEELVWPDESYCETRNTGIRKIRQSGKPKFEYLRLADQLQVLCETRDAEGIRDLLKKVFDWDSYVTGAL